MHTTSQFPAHAAFWRRLAARAAQLRRRLPAPLPVGASSPACAWLDQVAQSCPSPDDVQRARAVCLSQADYAQATSSQARALLLSSAGAGLLTSTILKNPGDQPQVPGKGADSSGKE